MAGLRKRKHASETAEASKQKLPSASQMNITDFGTIGKIAGDEQDLKKRKTSHSRRSSPSASNAASTFQRPQRKVEGKRKRDFESEDESDRDDGEKAAQVPRLSTPRNKRFKDARLPTPTDTPSKSAAALFGNLKLSVASQTIPCALQARAQTFDTPPSTPDNEKCMDYRLPQNLEELRQLHASFLSALSMYYSHNGTSSPVDVAALLPLITKHWKKRSVTLDDLRTILSIEKEGETHFTLKSFGRAGIRLTKSQPREKDTKRAASYVDEIELGMSFEAALRERWIGWLRTAPKDARTGTAFLEQISHVDIVRDQSAEKAAPMFARGQQRLADLRAGQAAAKSETPAAPEIKPQQKTTEAVQSRGTSLLDRILAKQAEAASLPGRPTKAQLERRLALQRIEDVTRVLESLTVGRARFSLGMPGMTQQVQQSLRNPISKEEVQQCLELMAQEVTPEFVKLVPNGGMTGVVVVRSGKVGLSELKQRVREAGA